MKTPPTKSSVLINGYISFISSLLTSLASISKRCAKVTCLLSSSSLSKVVATVSDPFCFKPVDKPVSF